MQQIQGGSPAVKLSFPKSQRFTTSASTTIRELKALRHAASLKATCAFADDDFSCFALSEDAETEFVRI